MRQLRIACWVLKATDTLRILNLHTGRSLTENTMRDAVLIQFDPLMMSTVLLKTCTGLS